MYEQKVAFAPDARPDSMLLDQPPSPVSPMPAYPLGANARLAGARRSVLMIGALAVIALVVLAASGHAQPAVAGPAALALALCAVVLAGRIPSGAAETAAETAGAAPIAASPGEAQTYALALELAPNPVFLVSGDDPDDFATRRIVFANAEARELLRIPREGAFLVSAVRNPLVLEAIDEALFGHLERTLSYETGGAETRYWRVWTKPLPAGAEHKRLALVILRDETDVRMNERMRADFLANASHELRTPLASLTGFIETLRGHAKDDPSARDRFLEIMSRQAERMARLIDDLLSLSRIELNEHVRPGGGCDLSMAVTDVVDALSPQIAEKAIGLKLELPPGGAADIVGDRDQIVQVVQNLLDNAVKYAPKGSEVHISVAGGLSLTAASASRAGDPRLAAPGGGRMSLLTPTRAPEACYGLVRVEDRGPGMSKEHLPRLTERFYRVEGQKSGERMGTGLGLAIVKHIVNRHRGGFLVESAPDQGAAFCVYFPMRQKAETPAAPAAATPREATPV